MNDTQQLVGALSNDLFRVASLSHRGANTGAQRFLLEAKRWAGPLHDQKVPPHIANIANQVFLKNDSPITLAEAEQYLMYGVLLQNYALHSLNP
ncbi:MAG: hypothetical protein WCL07_03675 [bacterium]